MKKENLHFTDNEKAKEAGRRSGAARRKKAAELQKLERKAELRNIENREKKLKDMSMPLTGAGDIDTSQILKMVLSGAFGVVLAERAITAICEAEIKRVTNRASKLELSIINDLSRSEKEALLASLEADLEAL
ncbi:hypothetical protein NMR59_001414 [Vibrio cholerae]|uniref:hypothetical protein n=1 Tax=Vibrio TaxID=662 RepID=UPI00031B306C|nr:MULTISPECIES: hypothetical protein [Vibrio]EJL6505011.1 hypothetical protein [Vibrio cholerae]MDW2265251.1 hypothetical protein [Vibrio sp. 1557]OQK14313.1 hypothetical protein AKL19_03435 [Vibrio parahaemolyticus O4:K55 str. NY3547]WAE59512.1 hypothetical protein OPR71_19775 [Vibrio alginolyticus]